MEAHFDEVIFAWTDEMCDEACDVIARCDEQVLFELRGMFWIGMFFEATKKVATTTQIAWHVILILKNKITPCASPCKIDEFVSASTHFVRLYLPQIQILLFFADSHKHLGEKLGANHL